MDSLIAFIAEKHDLAKENLATELFVRALDKSSVEVVREFLVSYGISELLLDFRFDSQCGLPGDRSIPDVQIRGSDKNLCALIESKFYARLTKHQPVDYLKKLPVGGVLLFIVPKKCEVARFDKLLETCRASGTFINMSISKPELTVSLDGRVMKVTSWNEALDRLERLYGSDKEYEELLADIKQIRRFCEVTDKEIFDPLTAEQIGGAEISSVIHQLIWITKELIYKCLEQEIVSPQEKTSLGLRAEVDTTSLSFGQDLRFCDTDIWLGFWVDQWEKRRSPLWIEVSHKALGKDTLKERIERVKGSQYVFRRDGGGWLIQIPISTGCAQEEVVEQAFQFIADIKKAGNSKGEMERPCE